MNRVEEIRMRAVPMSAITRHNRTILAGILGEPNVEVSERRRLFNWERILYEHGEIIHVALLIGNQIEGTTIQVNAQPGVVSVAMRETPNGPEFCTIAEERHYLTPEGIEKTIILLSFPQGHSLNSNYPTSSTLPIPFSIDETPDQTGRRELREEAGIYTENEGDDFGTSYRDPSFSPTEVKFMLYKVPPKMNNLLEQELEPTESIKKWTTCWRSLEELLRLRRSKEIREPRTLIAISYLEDLMRVDPNLRPHYLEEILYDASPEELKQVLRKIQEREKLKRAVSAKKQRFAEKSPYRQKRLPGFRGIPKKTEY